jgi:hypothetical protein
MKSVDAEILKRRNDEIAGDKKIPIVVVVHRRGFCPDGVSMQSTGTDCREP